MAATFAQVTTAIADAIDTNCDFASVHSTPPATLSLNSAIVSPAATWGTFTDQTFTDPAQSYEIIIVAAHAEFVDAFAWFQDRIAELIDDAFPDQTLGGVVDGCMVESWSQPQRVALGGVDGIAVYVQLSPLRAI